VGYCRSQEAVSRECRELVVTSIRLSYLDREEGGRIERWGGGNLGESKFSGYIGSRNGVILGKTLGNFWP